VPDHNETFIVTDGIHTGIAHSKYKIRCIGWCDTCGKENKPLHLDLKHHTYLICEECEE
jgi:hypothetical protein